MTAVTAMTAAAASPVTPCAIDVPERSPPPLAPRGALEGGTRHVPSRTVTRRDLRVESTRRVTSSTGRPHVLLERTRLASREDVTHHVLRGRDASTVTWGVSLWGCGCVRTGALWPGGTATTRPVTQGLGSPSQPESFADSDQTWPTRQRARAKLARARALSLAIMMPARLRVRLAATCSNWARLS